MVSGWQTMTDINCSTKEQFSPNHLGLQSMLVRAVSDCKSSNHIVISATRPYWWWKSSERKLCCAVTPSCLLTAYSMGVFMTQTLCMLGKCISHGIGSLQIPRAAHTRGCHSSSPSCQRVTEPLIGQFVTGAGLWLADAGHSLALDPGSGW